MGCFTDQLETGGAKLPVATCFLEQGGYLSLRLRSTEPKQTWLAGLPEGMRRLAEVMGRHRE